ncbi:hypothetical protein FLL45_12300 [Aliikangiella marina]|uniref:DUF1579 domain-containing protein n=1 Tax=Aliikangiella marina TaxID=1712262 RepID=A0A545T8Z1_9GAMM|nr:hypothetical protein [Aliikangiella marina]TQV73648.1 hypothetical protein FLL45_12300 [Aliikangiella marina]
MINFLTFSPRRNSKITQPNTKLLLLFCLLFNGLISGVIYAKNTQALGLFSGLIGQWSIDDYSLNAKGEWQPAGGADWHFYPILNGTAIQDDWISPSMSKPAPAQGRQFGTNIRIYNQKEKRWHMAWIANTGQKVESFKAIEQDGKIIMLGHYQGANTRITFFDINQNSFSWMMERETHANTKDKKIWQTIYKIQGTRVE